MSLRVYINNELCVLSRVEYELNTGSDNCIMYDAVLIKCFADEPGGWKKFSSEIKKRCVERLVELGVERHDTENYLTQAELVRIPRGGRYRVDDSMEFFEIRQCETDKIFVAWFIKQM